MRATPLLPSAPSHPPPKKKGGSLRFYRQTWHVSRLISFFKAKNCSIVWVVLSMFFFSFCLSPSSWRQGARKEGWGYERRRIDTKLQLKKKRRKRNKQTNNPPPTLLPPQKQQQQQQQQTNKHNNNNKKRKKRKNPNTPTYIRIRILTSFSELLQQQDFI